MIPVNTTIRFPRLVIHISHPDGSVLQREKDLVELSTTVDSGVSEVIRKQEEGYAYIKSGR